jgi:hypothetical protein
MSSRSAYISEDICYSKITKLFKKVDSTINYLTFAITKWEILKFRKYKMSSTYKYHKLFIKYLKIMKYLYANN